MAQGCIIFVPSNENEAAMLKGCGYMLKPTLEQYDLLSQACGNGRWVYYRFLGRRKEEYGRTGRLRQHPQEGLRRWDERSGGDAAAHKQENDS